MSQIEALCVECVAERDRGIDSLVHHQVRQSHPALRERRDSSESQSKTHKQTERERERNNRDKEKQRENGKRKRWEREHPVH